MAFTKKVIEVTINQDAAPSVIGPPPPPIVLKGLRMVADIDIIGLPGCNTASITISGMTQSDMNSISRAGINPFAQFNDVLTINAGEVDETTGKSKTAQIYGGIIFYAYQDFQAAPNTMFHIECKTGIFQNLKGAPASSYPNGADVAVIMADLAKKMNYDFEPNGVSVILPHPFFYGPLRLQMQWCADAANIYAFIENEKTLVLVDKLKARTGIVPVISAANGMVGYPNASTRGLASVRTEFNPAVKFLGAIKIEADPAIPHLSGTFFVRKLTHNLACELPNGPWFTDILCSVPSFSLPEPA